MYEITTGVTISFDGNNKRITLDFISTGATIDATDIYNFWVTWVIESGSSFLQAFNREGGESIAQNQNVSYYYILVNDWKLVTTTLLLTPIDLTLIGNLITSDNSNPFSPPESVGNFYIRSILSTNIITVTPTCYSAITEQLTSIESGVTSIEDNLILHRIETEDRIKYILGLVQQNFRIFNQVYNDKNLLTNASIRIYRNNSDAINNMNHLKEYNVSAAYDLDGKLIEYLVID